MFFKDKFQARFTDANTLKKMPTTIKLKIINKYYNLQFNKKV